MGSVVKGRLKALPSVILPNNHRYIGHQSSRAFTERIPGNSGLG